MSENIFEKVQEHFKPGVLDKEMIFYFKVDDIEKTVFLGPDKCRIEDGKKVEKADCYCKLTSSLFEKIVNEKYKPVMRDFVSGSITADKPFLLLDFLKAFGQ